MDKKRSILNISISITTKVIVLVFAIVLKSLLIRFCGNDTNGLYSLFTSILGFLAIADLGVGTAISFSMYKPIVEGNTKKVAALYNLYKKVYFIVGICVAVGGLIVMPFLPTLAKDYSSSYNIYLTYSIMLIAVVLTYAYSSKVSLINAYKNNYVTTLINSIATITRRIIQLFVLIFTHSFEIYLLAKIVGVSVEWLLVELYSRKHYKELITTKEKVDQETKHEVVKNTKAMFMHKIGAVVVSTIDGIIISACLGVAILGKYSNYLIIITSMVTVLNLFFTPITSVIGHLCATGNVKEERKYFRFMYFLNFTVGIVFFLGYYAIINNLVSIFFGGDLVMDYSIPFVLTLNYFIQYMRQTVLLYRDATGVFYQDRFKPIFEGILNLSLSLLFVQWFGVVGVIVATIITNVFICHIVEPYILYKHGFKQPKDKVKYYILNYFLILVFVVALICLQNIMIHSSSGIVELFANGFIAVGIACVPLLFMFIFFKTYRENLKKLCSQTIDFVKKIFKKKENKEKEENMP